MKIRVEVRGLPAQLQLNEEYEATCVIVNRLTEPRKPAVAVAHEGHAAGRPPLLEKFTRTSARSRAGPAQISRQKFFAQLAAGHVAIDAGCAVVELDTDEEWIMPNFYWTWWSPRRAFRRRCPPSRSGLRQMSSRARRRRSRRSPTSSHRCTDAPPSTNSSASNLLDLSSAGIAAQEAVFAAPPPADRLALMSPPRLRRAPSTRARGCRRSRPRRRPPTTPPPLPEIARAPMPSPDPLPTTGTCGRRRRRRRLRATRSTSSGATSPTTVLWRSPRLGDLGGFTRPDAASKRPAPHRRAAHSGRPDDYSAGRGTRAARRRARLRPPGAADLFPDDPCREGGSAARRRHEGSGRRPRHCFERAVRLPVFAPMDEAPRDHRRRFEPQKNRDARRDRPTRGPFVINNANARAR